METGFRRQDHLTRHLNTAHIESTASQATISGYTDSHSAAESSPFHMSEAVSSPLHPSENFWNPVFPE